ncbi:MAG: hypothetical protein WD009_13340 [Phycisphaeraceae bacterium]
MNKLTRMSRLAPVLALLVLVGLAAPALAQPGDVGAAPDAFPQWVPIVLAVFLILWAGAISFMSSRRSHRD